MIGRTNSGGGLANAFAVIGAVYPAGSVCTCTNGTKTLKAKDTGGSFLFFIPEAGTWTVTATDGTDTASESVIISTQYQAKSIELDYRMPSTYQEVAYLEASGSQYINTGIKTDNTHVRFQVMFTYASTYQCAFGTSRNYARIDGSKSMELSAGDNCKYSKTISLNTVHDLELCMIPGNQFIKLNGELVKSATGTNSKNLDMYMFASNNGGDGIASKMKGRIYTVSFYLGSGEETLIAQFIPCYRKSDKAAGMWERISKTFYENDGTGTFIAGEDVL